MALNLETIAKEAAEHAYQAELRKAILSLWQERDTLKAELEMLKKPKGKK